MQRIAPAPTILRVVPQHGRLTGDLPVEHFEAAPRDVRSRSVNRLRRSNLRHAGRRGGDERELGVQRRADEDRHPCAGEPLRQRRGDRGATPGERDGADVAEGDTLDFGTARAHHQRAVTEREIRAVTEHVKVAVFEQNASCERLRRAL